jgi:hypothetical protein
LESRVLFSASGLQLQDGMKLPNVEAVTRARVEPLALTTHAFFTPDCSLEWQESGDLKLFRFFASLRGEGNPPGKLVDGRPFIHFTDIGPDFVADHYLVDCKGLEHATETTLRNLLLRSDIDWPVHLDPAAVSFAVQNTNDDLGRAILDLEVRYPFSIPGTDG